MAKKIDAETAKTLKNLGITAKTEEEARKKLVAALEKEGIEGMEDESLAALIDMADGFLNDGENDTEDEVEEETTDETEADTDEEMDELADEVEAENDTEDEVEEETTDETDDEEHEEEEKPAKPAKKAAPAKKAKATKEKVEKPAKTAKQTTSSRGQKLDPQNNEDDRKVLDDIKKMFGKDYGFDYVKSNGATVKHLGKNGKRGVILIENLTRHHNGTVTCNLYLLTMTKQTEILDEMGIDYTLCWTKAPMMKNITLEEVKEILEKVFETITGAVVKIDKRLGDNRKKMEENLQKTEKKSAKKTVEPEPEEVDDEEEDEVDEEEKPAKPAKKAAPAKKVAKKAKK